jgi:hypothetical protein
VTATFYFDLAADELFWGDDRLQDTATLLR